MKSTLIISVLIIVMMSGMAVAFCDQIYGTMSSNCSECADCTDVVHAMENLPFAQFDAMSADVIITGAPVTSVSVTVEEEWLYGRRNVAPEGIEHVYYDFEEGMNLYPFKNAHPGVASFENVSDSYCCWPCEDIHEPSYVRQGANSGPNCRCIMYIYPTSRKFTNGTDIPYIHVVNGYAAFAPRVLSSWCYYPACRAFIGFKDDTNFVSFLASTNNNLYVRAYDPKGNYLDGGTIYYTTDRVGDGPSNFTRFTMYTPGDEIGSMTFSGPFNGWHIDDMIVGGEPGYLGLRRDYGWAAERMRQLIGAPYNEFAIGYDLVFKEFLTAEEIIAGDQVYYDPTTGEFGYEPGIYDQNAIVWAFNVNDIGVTEHIVKHYDINDLEKFDFDTEVAYEDIQPGDVFFIDYPQEDPNTGLMVPDGCYDEVGIVIPPQYDSDGNCEDCIRVLKDGGVQYGSTEFVNFLYGTSGFVDYRCLPDEPRIGKSPYPRPPKGMPI